jgi:two-component system sensor histidine kinase KdpD
MLLRRGWLSLTMMAAVAAATAAGRHVAGVNAATMGFIYLLLVLWAATVWGFVEAVAAAVTATLALNYYFLPPLRRLTIADPENWVALFSFLATALVVSRLSSTAQRRTAEARAHQREMARLYGFSRSLLLTEAEEPFARQLTRKLAQSFDLEGVLLFDRSSGVYQRAGSAELSGWEEKLRQVANDGRPQRDAGTVGLPVRLGASPIAAVALRPDALPEPLLQALANLTAIALEHARAQELEAHVAAAQRGERLRTALLDALEHEFKTPLTSVLAATSALLAEELMPAESRRELLQVADEEARHLREIMDDALAMARLDAGTLEPVAEAVRLRELVGEALTALGRSAEDHRVEIREAGQAAACLDRRLVRLAVKQLLDNAFKYSPPGTPVTVDLAGDAAGASITVTDHGAGIAPAELERIFDRLYRSPRVEEQIPGSGLGLGIALTIARAHGGDLTVESRPGETRFRMWLPHRSGETA